MFYKKGGVSEFKRLQFAVSSQKINSEEIHISYGHFLFFFLPFKHKLALAKMQCLEEVYKLSTKLLLLTLGNLIIRVYQN